MGQSSGLICLGTHWDQGSLVVGLHSWSPRRASGLQILFLDLTELYWAICDRCLAIGDWGIGFLLNCMN